MSRLRIKMSPGFADTSVLARLGCYSKIPQTEWLINNRNLFLVVLEAGSQIGVPAWSGEDPLLGHGLLTVSSHGGRGHGSSFIRTLTLLKRAPPS